MRTWEFLHSCRNLLRQLFLSIPGTGERTGLVFTFHLICKRKNPFIPHYVSSKLVIYIYILPTPLLHPSADFCESHCTRHTPLPGVSVKLFHPPLFGPCTVMGCDLSLESGCVHRNKNKNSVVWLRYRAGDGGGGGPVVTCHSQCDSTWSSSRGVASNSSAKAQEIKLLIKRTLFYNVWGWSYLLGFSEKNWAK